ncbi:hypothetical protein [Pseudomonas syringae group genomosp. 3]|uniref:Uncharacterized protein n=1 Tax=Pseudomonas syringae pv. primulae TaxID=251707 RepID=A0A3M3Y7H7_9PSED|nr:hypothetical protein [Pseudomonas syringae group genomosp. 3]RMO77624.1 hypothetical protein ALQ36_00822 [Pseudomonas syringae pv. primulae]RMU32655.1 hypothetical protein ALP30_03046 [Pseudomonas syringae pv. primulae]
MPEAYIIYHGTSQDWSSDKENTVALARALRAAGKMVIDIGGPGSSERAIKTSIRDDYYLRNKIPHPIDEISFPTDIGINILSGIIRGKGIYDSVSEGVEAFEELLANGFCTIKIIGFSRGAVAAAMLLTQLEKTKRISSTPIYVDVALLDPVPGPFTVPTSLTIPGWVRKVYVQFSEHESRLGFQALDVSFASDKTKVIIDTSIGVHGDIGGSTQSSVSKLNLDMLKRHMDLPLARLSPENFVELFSLSLYESESYSNPGFRDEIRRGQGMSRRPGGGLLEGLASASPLIKIQAENYSPEIQRTFATGFVQPPVFSQPSLFSNVINRYANNGMTPISMRPLPLVSSGRIQTFPRYPQLIRQLPVGGRTGRLGALAASALFAGGMYLGGKTSQSSTE